MANLKKEISIVDNVKFSPTSSLTLITRANCSHR